MMMNRAQLTKKSQCPYCNHVLDAHGVAFSEQPLDGKVQAEPGDLTVCFYCAQILVFHNNLTVQKPNPGQLEMLYLTKPWLKDRMALLTEAVRRIDRRNLNPQPMLPVLNAERRRRK
jgi:hypothetical protein